MGVKGFDEPVALDGLCQNSDNDAKSGAIWGREAAPAESNGGPRDD